MYIFIYIYIYILYIYIPGGDPGDRTEVQQ